MLNMLNILAKITPLFFATFSSCTSEYSVKAKLKVTIVSIALSQLCYLRVGAHLCLHGPEPAVSCRHSSVMWAVDHTSVTYCHYLPSV